jgi:hypothetical protein
MRHFRLAPFRSPAALAAVAGLAGLAAVAGLAGLAAVAGLAGCSFSGGDGDSPLGGSFSVTGKVVDFRTGADLTESASLSASGLLPAPEISLEGAAFEISGVPANSAFQLLATAPLLYRPTFSPLISLGEEDLTEAVAPVVSELFLAQLISAFGITPNAERGILLARVVDGNTGLPKTGVSAASFVLGKTGISAAKFLDASMIGARDATATSASGWVVFFDVPVGVTSLIQADTASVTLEMATSPISAGTVTVAEIHAVDGPPPKLTKVSFATQVVPIFTARGCVTCHAGKGKDRGGLTLNGGASKIYKELLTEDPTRVLVGTPEQSLLLTMPSFEAPPDRHPNVTFTSAADLDFQKIYVWIKEGAKNN